MARRMCPNMEGTLFHQPVRCFVMFLITEYRCCTPRSNSFSEAILEK